MFHTEDPQLSIRRHRTKFSRHRDLRTAGIYRRLPHEFEFDLYRSAILRIYREQVDTFFSYFVQNIYFGYKL